MTESMEKILKQRRLDESLSIETIAKDLRIRKEHLKQFEKKIPDPLTVYELGYLRSYAKYLNLDINDYVARRKERDIITAQSIKDSQKNKIFSVIKKPKSSIIIVISICALVASVALLGIMGKKDSTPVAPQDQEQSAPAQQDFLAEKKGPYEYLITGIGSTSEVNIVARVKTNYTIIDPVTKKIISTGELQPGEQLFVPKENQDKIFTSILVKTNALNAFDIQQIAQTK